MKTSKDLLWPTVSGLLVVIATPIIGKASAKLIEVVMSANFIMQWWRGVVFSLAFIAVLLAIRYIEKRKESRSKIENLYKNIRELHVLYYNFYQNFMDSPAYKDEQLKNGILNEWSRRNNEILAVFEKLKP